MSHSASELPVTVYSPESPLRNPLKLIREILGDIWSSRELVWILFLRDLKASYRQSYLGYIWIIFPPLTAAAVWIYLNGSGIVSTAETPIPFAAFALIGTTLWTTLTSAFNAPLGGFMGGSAVFMKLKVPPEAFIASSLGKVLFDTGIRLLLLIPLYFIYPLNPGWHALLLPVAILAILLFGTALGYWLIPIGGLYGDVARAVGLAMPLLMYTAPVVYPMVSKKNFAYYLMEYNPATPLVMTGRDWLTTGSSLHAPELLVLLAVSLPVLLAGMVILRVAMPHLVVRMGM